MIAFREVRCSNLSEWMCLASSFDELEKLTKSGRMSDSYLLFSSLWSRSVWGLWVSSIHFEFMSLEMPGDSPHIFPAVLLTCDELDAVFLGESRLRVECGISFWEIFGGKVAR